MSLKDELDLARSRLETQSAVLRDLEESLKVSESQGLKITARTLKERHKRAAKLVSDTKGVIAELEVALGALPLGEPHKPVRR